MKKNKIAISTFAAVCIIGTIVGYSLIKQSENHKYDELAIMTQQDDGTYIKSNMSAFGNDDYEFDHAVCNNGTTVTANSSGGVNLKLLKTDKCTVYLKKSKTVTEQIKDLAQSSTSSMFQSAEPSNEIKSVKNDNFNKEEQTYTVDTTHQNYYMTYADSYTFNTPTMTSSGSDYPSYTLTNPQVAKYSDIYGSLAGKYIVNYEGHNLSTMAYYGQLNNNSYGLNRIYKVVKATATEVTYIPSSYTIEFTDNGTTGVYTAEDDYGTSYYFRGNVTNNYVKFGKLSNDIYRGYSDDQSVYTEYFTKNECLNDTSKANYINGKNQGMNNGCNKSPVAGKDMYWRIVRLNGDGSLRLMYDGTEAYSNGTMNEDRIALRVQQFNTSDNNNAYVGYMYGDINGTTYDAVHANSNSSLIKTAIETWYKKNFVGTTYENKIGDMLFCNDRSVTSGTGTGSMTTFGASKRLSTNKSPNLICPQKNDAFTVNDTVKGNGKLKYPVGLLTADEVALLGGKNGTINRGYFINKGYEYWLGSPSSRSYSSYVFKVGSDGNIGHNYVNRGQAVVPVINIPKEYIETMTGKGTMESPYEVTGILPEGYHIVTFDASGVSPDYIVPKIVKEGEPYGILPVIEEFLTYYYDYTFDGWYTKPYGNGNKIISSTIVTSSANNQILYPEVHKVIEPQKPE